MNQEEIAREESLLDLLRQVLPIVSKHGSDEHADALLRQTIRRQEDRVGRLRLGLPGGERISRKSTVAKNKLKRLR